MKFGTIFIIFLVYSMLFAVTLTGAYITLAMSKEMITLPYRTIQILWFASFIFIGAMTVRGGPSTASWGYKNLLSWAGFLILLANISIFHFVVMTREWLVIPAVLMSFSALVFAHWLKETSRFFGTEQQGLGIFLNFIGFGVHTSRDIFKEVKNYQDDHKIKEEIK